MGLQNLNGWEMMVIVLVGLFIFGPDRLPKVIGDGMRLLKNVRQMARNATSDLSRELGTQVELEDLHPKTFLRKHLLSEADEAALRKPLDDVYGDLRGVADSLNGGRPGGATGYGVDATDGADPVVEQAVQQAPVEAERLPAKRGYDDVT